MSMLKGLIYVLLDTMMHHYKTKIDMNSKWPTIVNSDLFGVYCVVFVEANFNLHK